MTKAFITIGALLALALAAASSAAGSARWTTYPTCTATTAALTCTGKAVGLEPKFVSGLGPVEAGIQGEVHYTCIDPVFEASFFGFPMDVPAEFSYLASGTFHNGKQFRVEFSPPSGIPGITAAAACPGGWTRPDGSYYNVSVTVGWGFGSHTPIEALDAPIGAVLPG